MRKEDKRIRDFIIKEKYKNKDTRYKELYKYILELYDNDGIWYIREYKTNHKTNKTFVEMLGLIISFLTLYFSVAIDILEKFGEPGLEGVVFLIMACIILRTLNVASRFTKDRYVIGIMEDIEKDKTLYDGHGKNMNQQLLEQLVS